MKEKINCLQFGSTFILVIVSSFMGIGIYSLVRASGVDSYISVLMAAILGIPLILLFLYIASYEPDLALPDKLVKLYGPVFGKIVSFILALFIINFSINYMFNLTNFIVSQFLPETPIMVIGLVFSIVIIYANMKGIETITRLSLIILTINLILFLIGGLGLMPSFSLDNLKPLLEFGIGRPFQSTFYTISLTLMPLFTLLIIPKNQLIDHKNFNKYVFGSYSLAMLLIFIIVFFSLGILGIYLTSIYQYPEYMVLKHVNLFGFLDRIENIVTAQWIFGLYFCLTFMVYFISNSIKMKHKSKSLPIVITLLILCVCTYLIPNNTAFNNYIYQTVSILRFAFGIILCIIGVSILIKKRFIKKTS